MSLTWAILGKRLRLARENVRITQEKAAAHLGIPRTAIVQIEAGNRSISTLELSELSRLYNRPIEDFFHDKESVGEEDIFVALYRALPGVEEDEEIKQKVTRCLNKCRECYELVKLLNPGFRNVLPIYENMNPPRNTGDAIEQGTIVAKHERQRLNLGYAPIPDISILICSQGIWASGTKLPYGVSGVFLHHPFLGMSILVNIDEPRYRKRFSYAHEYAHGLLDRNESIKVTKTENRNELAEIRANSFAAAFLMPENGVEAFISSLGKGNPTRDTFPVYNSSAEEMSIPPIQVERRSAPGSQNISWHDVASLAGHFSVSYQAATYRLKSLKWINKTECENLLAQENYGSRYLKTWGQDPEEESPDRCLDQEIAYLALEALRREVISKGRFNDIVDLLEFDDEVSFRQLADSL